MFIDICWSLDQRRSHCAISLMDILGAAWWVCAAVGFLALSTYLLPVIIQQFFSEQDLKQKYGANWALVTGGSSGIGKAIVRKLAMQKINVVIVALPDKLLDETLKELRGEFKQLRFVPVGVNLGATEPEEYMKPIRDATKDLQCAWYSITLASFCLVSFTKCHSKST
jgi:hypothetical protein